jgi:hypothetical protein
MKHLSVAALAYRRRKYRQDYKCKRKIAECIRKMSAQCLEKNLEWLANIILKASNSKSL